MTRIAERKFALKPEPRPELVQAYVGVHVYENSAEIVSYLVSFGVHAIELKYDRPGRYLSAVIFDADDSSLSKFQALHGDWILRNLDTDEFEFRSGAWVQRYLLDMENA